MLVKLLNNNIKSDIKNNALPIIKIKFKIKNVRTKTLLNPLGLTLQKKKKG